MKKTIFVLAAVLVLAGLLTNTGCKKKNEFDITGVWYFTITILNESFDETYTFSGDDRAGEVLWDGQVLGTYSASGGYVNFTLEYYDQDDDYTVEVYSGSFDTDRMMSGDVTITIEGYASVSGTWEAGR